MTRDELIKEIHQLPFDHPDADIDEVEGIIADFVIAKQTAIIEDVSKYEYGIADEHIPDDKEDAYNLGCQNTKDDILSIIQRIRGEK